MLPNMSELFKIMDIGHRGLLLDEALTELETAVSDCIFHGKVRAIKVIHGHGSGALKRRVREWCESVPDYPGYFHDHRNPPGLSWIVRTCREYPGYSLLWRGVPPISFFYFCGVPIFRVHKPIFSAAPSAPRILSDATEISGF